MKKILVLFLWVLPFCIHAQLTTPVTPTITLNAKGTLYKPADELQMNVGVVSVSNTAEQALLENSRKMEDVIHALLSAGLTEKEFETGHFSINPTYTPYPKNPPPDWKQSINGYEVSNTIFIHTNLIDSAGKLIDAANKSGANQIHSIRFVLHDQRLHWDEAISLAVENAMHDAQTIAKAANLKLVRILSISLENDGAVGPRSVLYAAKNYESAPPIEAGDVPVTANIAITYEIAPK